MRKFQKVCNKLNKILENRPENREEFIGRINYLIDKEIFQCGGNLYWGRDLFIDCNGDSELCRKAIHTHKVMFRPTCDPIEHPGITMCYKNSENDYIIEKKEIELAAEKTLPYETHPNKFIKDMRNKAIDFGRLCFVKGAEFILNNPQIVCRKFK